MSRNPVIDALVGEIDQTLIGLQAARKLALDLQRTLRELDLGDATRRRGRPLATAPSIRYSGVTVAEAAGMLGVSEEHVRRLLRRGELTGVAFGGRTGWRLPRDAVERVAELWEAQRSARDDARSTRPAGRRGAKRRR